MLKNGYKVRILNTINFKKSMHYNPFAYVHSEKDILKLVTTLMTNTKGEGSGGDPFWEKSERLLLTALIAYLHIVCLCSSRINPLTMRCLYRPPLADVLALYFALLFCFWLD